MKKSPLLLAVRLFLNACRYDDRLHWILINVNSTGKPGDAHLIYKGDSVYMIDT